jgi:predicted ATP-dependent endonuclease of OLD family
MKYASPCVVKALQVRNFRSLAQTGVGSCGALNVFIGRNNAGKSDPLACIASIRALAPPS